MMIIAYNLLYYVVGVVAELGEHCGRSGRISIGCYSPLKKDEADT